MSEKMTYPFKPDRKLFESIGKLLLGRYVEETTELVPKFPRPKAVIQKYKKLDGLIESGIERVRVNVKNDDDFLSVVFDYVYRGKNLVIFDGEDFFYFTSTSK